MNKKQFASAFVLALLLISVFALTPLSNIMRFPEIATVKADTTIDSYSETNRDETTALTEVHPSASSSRSSCAQSFTGTAGYNLTSAKFHLMKIGSPVAIMVATLYAITGTYGSTGKPTGSALATSDGVQMSSLTGGFVLTTFTFSTPYELSSQYYVISCEVQSKTTLDGDNCAYVGRDDSSPSHGGNLALYQSSAWTAYSGIDEIFYVIGTEVAPPDADPPTFGTITANTTLAGNGTRISCTISDATAVDFWGYATNNTGSTVNASKTDVNGSPISAYFDITWNTTVGNTVWVEFWANDTLNNAGYSGATYFTLTSEGVDPLESDADYIIYLDSGTVHVYNVTADEDAYSSSNVALAFNTAFGYLTNKKLVVRPATYTFASNVQMGSYGNDVPNATIAFETGAITAIANSLDINVLNFWYLSNTTVLYPQINGNAAGQTQDTEAVSNGIGAYDTSGLLILNATITNCARNGFEISLDANKVGSLPNGIVNSTITFCGWNGMTLGGGNVNAIGCYAYNNTIMYCSDVGISSYGYDSTISNNLVCHMNGTMNTQAHWGIGLEDGYALVTENIVYDCHNGIEDTDTKAPSMISNNLVYDCDTHGIVLYGCASGQIVANNTIYDWGTGWGFGIYLLEEDGLDYLYGNDLSGDISQIIYLVDNAVYPLIWNNTGISPEYKMLNVTVVGDGTISIGTDLLATSSLGWQNETDSTLSVVWEPNPAQSRVDFEVDGANQTTTTSPIIITMDTDHEGIAYFTDVAVTWTLSVSWITPTVGVKTSPTVPYSVSTTGNETGVTYQIQLYNASVEVYGINFTSASGSFTGLVNGTYTAAVYVEGDNGAWDYEEVYFTVQIITSEGTPFWVLATIGLGIGSLGAGVTIGYYRHRKGKGYGGFTREPTVGAGSE